MAAVSRLVACVLPPRTPIELSLAFHDDPIRPDIFKARYKVYVEELGQYPPNARKQLADYTDAYNVYIVARKRGVLCGFVAITPPGHPKAFERHGVTPEDDKSHEIRVLTVLPGSRAQGVATALMYAAHRFIEASGGSSAEALARIEVLPMYERLGMTQVSDTTITCGRVSFAHISGAGNVQVALPRGFVWNLPFPVRATKACMHGGAGLESLRPEGIHADVLDAWFQPAPAVVKAVNHHPNDIRLTPPTRANDVLNELATQRNLNPAHVLLGAGSSDLLYRCFWTWLSPESHVLLLSPTYAEYEHVLSAIGCKVTRLVVSASTGYVLTRDCIPPGTYDLVVLTNPNCPTGVLSDIMSIVTAFPTRTRVWVDETYIDYAGTEHSFEQFVPKFPNVIICKSMSKAYAMSGLRVGYVYADSMHLDAVRARSPPWIVSRVAQRAIVEALRSQTYYQDQYEQTHALRNRLEEFLAGLGWSVVPGSCANFVMASLPPGLSACALVDECKRELLYIRAIDEHTVRIAVKGRMTLERMMRIVQDASNRLSRREGPCCQ